MRMILRNCSRFFSVMCLCLLTQSYFIAAQTSANEQSKPEAGKSVHQMFMDDQDTTKHTIRFVAVEPGVKLEILDYGGRSCRPATAIKSGCARGSA
jgi:hypothetical protein